MENKITGRIKEQKRLRELYCSGKPEFVAVYGRRRVGKTLFDLAGLANASTREQLVNFTLSLNRASGGQSKPAQNWLMAFEQLIALLENSPKERKLIFILRFSKKQIFKHCSQRNCVGRFVCITRNRVVTINLKPCKLGWHESSYS